MLLPGLRSQLTLIMRALVRLRMVFVEVLLQLMVALELLQFFDVRAANFKRFFLKMHLIFSIHHAIFSGIFHWCNGHPE